MLSIKTKIYLLSKLYSVEESEINEKFIQDELFLINSWDEFEELDNEDFYDQIIVDDEDKESAISLIFDYDELRFIDFIGGYQEFYECSNDYFLNMVQDFLIELFSEEIRKGEIEPISNIEVIRNKIRYHFKLKVEYPIKSILLKILSPIIKKHYGIKEIPFCMETTPLKKWGEEFVFEWMLENEEELEEI